jgi:hypothetical protein
MPTRHCGIFSKNARTKLDGLNVEQSNGFKGAIDPTPYFTGEYLGEVRPLSASDSSRYSQPRR